MDNPLVSPEPGIIIWTLINFTILVLVLRKIAWKPITSALDKREQTIKESLDSAKTAAEEATAELEKARKAVTEARQEAQSILSQAKADAESVAVQVRSKAQAEADAKLKDALRDIEKERAAAVQEIRGHAVDLAIAAAGKLVSVSMDPSQQRRLVDQYIKDLPSAVSDGPSA